MKDIAVPTHIIMHSTGANPVNLDIAVTHAVEARRNGNKVILGGLYIERELEQVIGFYLYPSPDISEQQRFVAAHILGSDTLTFAAKRRLVLTLVNDKKLLEGTTKSTFESQLKKVMSFRNAFTHGDVFERDDKTYLRYFEGSPREQELTDAFWEEVEATFHSLGKLIETIKHALGVPPAGGAPEA